MSYNIGADSPGGSMTIQCKHLRVARMRRCQGMQLWI